MYFQFLSVNTTKNKKYTMDLCKQCFLAPEAGKALWSFQTLKASQQ